HDRRHPTPAAGRVHVRHMRRQPRHHPHPPKGRRLMYRHDDELTLMDWFCGAGGSSQGVHAVPGVRVERAANHWKLAIESHAANFPTTSHYQGDIRKAPVWDWPVTDIFWASPECFPRSEEHTSELQSRENLVCRLLLEKKK